MKVRFSPVTIATVILLSAVALSIICIQNCCAQKVSQKASAYKTDPELGYFDLRNRYIRYFKGVENSADGDRIFKQEADSLKQLENKLKDILKECDNANIFKEGKINLETLFDGIGFGKLDGLSVVKDSMILFCTSKKSFNFYFKDKKINEFDNLSSNELREIFSSAFLTDEALTDFTSYKMTAPKGFIAYGMLGVVAQDIGPILPEFLYALVATEGYVYMAELTIKNQIKDITGCKEAWDDSYSRAGKCLEIYRASNLKDTAAFNEGINLENKAWDAYTKCYQNSFRTTTQFSKVQKQLEEMAKLIEH